MKKTIALFVLVFAFASAFAQLRLTGTGSGWTTVNDSTYSTTFTRNADLTGNGYTCNLVQVGHRVVSGTAANGISTALKMYRISAYANRNASTIDITVIEYAGTQGAPSGQIYVFDPNGKLTIPQAPFGSTGAAAAMQAAVDTWNSRLLFAVRSTNGAPSGAPTQANPQETAQDTSAAGGNKLYRWDGAAWQEMGGGGVTVGDKNEIDVVNATTDWRLDTNAVKTVNILNNAVTLAKEANGTANRLKGYNGSGISSEITVSGILALAAGNLSATEVDGSTSNELDNLDQAYNNFGSSASTITVDAAQGQTGGLTIAASATNNPPINIDLQGTGDFSILDASATTTPVFRAHDNGDVTFGINGVNPTNGDLGLFFDYSKRALRGGETGFSGVSTWSDANIGSHSFAWGITPVASGLYSAAFGSGKAQAIYAFAAGSGIASGQYSAAFGNATTASGLYSFTAGISNTSSGAGGFTGGNTNTNAGDNTVTYGTSLTVGSATDNGAVFGSSLSVNAVRLFAFGNGAGTDVVTPQYTGARRMVYFGQSPLPTLKSFSFANSNTIGSVSGTTITVGSTSSYVANEYLVLENGTTSEIVKIVSITNGTQMVVTPAPTVTTGSIWGNGGNWFEVGAGAQDFLQVGRTGQLKIPTYTTANTEFDATPTKYLGVDASGNVVKSALVINDPCNKTVTQTAHGLTLGTPVYWTGTAYATIVGNFGSVTTPSGIVTAVADANTFTLTTCGGTATDLSLADGLYYATNTGLSTTASDPEMPMFKAEGSRGTVDPMLAFAVAADPLFTITTTNGANSIIEGETFVLAADSILNMFADIAITGDNATTAVTPTAKFYTVTINTSANPEPITLPAPVAAYRSVTVTVKQIGSATNAVTVSAVGGGSDFYDSDATSTTSTVAAGGGSKSYKCVVTTSPSTYKWIVI